MKQIISKLKQLITGKTELGLDVAFQAELEEFLTKNEQRVKQWHEQHPNRLPPIAIDPASKKLVWASRSMRRSR